MRVAVDARSLLCRQPRGEGKCLLRLYQEVARLRPQVQVLLFGDAAAGHYDGALPPGARVVSFDGPGDRFEAWEQLYFPLRALMAGCHVMHCTSSGAPRWCPLPMLLTVHDLIPLVFDDGHTPAARHTFRRRLEHGLAQARAVLAVSEHTRQDIGRLYPQHLARIEVMHWGCDGDGTGHAPQRDAAYLLAFGGEAPRKNTEYTLERFIGAAGRVAGLRLVMTGLNSERQRQAIVRRCEEAGVADRVDLPGFVSEPELARLMRGATALLYLSRYEGFGVPLVEAIGLGLPVIASDRTSVAEVMHGVPGGHSLEDPGSIEDTIVRVVTDSTAAAALARAQAAVLPRYSWPRAASRLLALLDAAAGGRTGAPATLDKIS